MIFVRENGDRRFLGDAPVTLVIGPKNYWMFGIYNRRRNETPFLGVDAKLDGFSTPASRLKKIDQFKTQELYDHIHSLQPQVLVSYKQGLLGTEDFKAPERKFKGESKVPLELCDTLQPHGWGDTKKDDGKHKTADKVMKMLANAKKLNANLLLNTGPLPDGSIHPEDIKTLKEVGRRRRS